MKNKTLPNKLRKYRKDNSLTQQALADILKVDSSLISHVEAGRRFPYAMLFALVKLTDGFITKDDVFAYAVKK